MKLSLNWIRDFVTLPEELDLSRLAYDITMSTVEVEGAESLARGFDRIVVGRILEVLPHPNADQLRICRVDLGDGTPHEIVCGGSNLEPQMLVAVACPGAMVRWHGEGEPVKIKRSKLRGVESYGMICASDEIGLGDLFPASAEAEIIDLSAFAAQPGQNLAEALELDDIILEIDNKSMTNRPDLWGHYGMAREIAALYDLPLRPLTPYAPPAGIEAYPVQIDDETRCPRYLAVRMEGLRVKEAPFAMRSRLWRVGLRPINALVDITNYVMMAVGQPTHAFDAGMVSGGICVRRAAAGEALRLLNGKELALQADDLVIADGREALALAGVMGGAKDSILPDTTSVLLEIASFEATGIRRTALRYNNRTDASTRYEKAIDPERCEQALSLSMALFAELYPELKVTAFADCYPRRLKPAEIDLSYDWLDRRLGKHLTQEQLSRKLGLLGFTVGFDGDRMHVTAPSWRSTGDVSIPADIMEEAARMVGYENFTASAITTTFSGAINQLDKNLLRSIEEYLAYRCGMQEVLTYPWMREDFVQAVLGTSDGLLCIATPPSPEERFVRSSTLPNLCQAVAGNERYYEDFAIFEEAQVARADEFHSPHDPAELLPRQRRVIGCAFAARTDGLEGITRLFRRAKGVFSEMPRFTHMEGFRFEKTEKPVWADATVWLNLYVGERRVGDLGLLSKRASMACGIRNLSVVLAELNTEELIPFRSRTNTFAHLPAYPVTEYDLSMLVSSETSWEAVRAAVAAMHNRLVREVRFVDEYRGRQIPAGRKSLTIRLLIGSEEKTLTSAEIESAADAVIKTLGKRLSAEIRSR